MAKTVEWERQVPAFYSEDSKTLKDEIERIGAKSVLEFGPGDSTQTLIDLGLERIVTCEHVPKWLAVAKKRFAKCKQVKVLSFTDTVPVVIDGLDPNERFDIAFVDTPKGGIARDVRMFERKIHPEFPDCSRLNTMLMALHHADVVLLHDAKRPLERATLMRLYSTGKVDITFLPNPLGVARIEKRDKDTHRPDLPKPKKSRRAPARAAAKRRRVPVDKGSDRLCVCGPGEAERGGDKHDNVQ